MESDAASPAHSIPARSRPVMKRSLWIAFGCLCLVSSSAWALAPFESSTLPPLERLALLYLAIGLCALLASGSSWWHRMRQRSSAHLAFASIMFFGFPALAIELASGSVPEITRSALFAMVPVVVAIVIAASEAGTPGENSARRSLLPALAGLDGLLLLLPLNLPGSVRGRLMLAVICSAVILVGISSVRLYRLLQGFKPANAAALMCISNAVFLLAYGLVRRTFIWHISDLVSFVSVSSLINLIEIVLLLWLVRNLSPVPFAARFLIIPLLTVLEAYVLLHPRLTLRISTGVALLIVGAGMLVFANPNRDEVPLSLR
jgi:drug/metabolite transporter (DMT)-like permease